MATKKTTPATTPSVEVLARNEEVEASKRIARVKKAAKYVIQSPDEVRNSPEMEILTQLHIHEGPATDPETGAEVWREGGIVELIRGVGYTEDPLWAAYLQEQWGQREPNAKLRDPGRKGLIIRKLNPFTNRLEEVKYAGEVEKLRALIDGDETAEEEESLELAAV